jgi:hypothetical protein
MTSPKARENCPHRMAARRGRVLTKSRAHSTDDPSFGVRVVDLARSLGAAPGVTPR